MADQIDTNAATLEMQPPPAGFDACDLCGVNVAPGWHRWEEGQCCGLRVACDECHAKVRAVLARLLAAGKRMSLGAVAELARRLEQGPPAAPPLLPPTLLRDRQALSWVEAVGILREVVPAEQMGGSGAVRWLVDAYKAAQAKAEDRTRPPMEAPPDGAPTGDVAAYVRLCASGWRPEARILGNARAEDVVRMCDALIRYQSGTLRFPTRWSAASAAAARLVRQLEHWVPDWFAGAKLGPQALDGVRSRFAAEIATWLRRPVPEAGDYPPGYVERLVEAVCRLNLACEDIAGESPERPTSIDRLPDELTNALAEVRDLAFLECPGCTEAAGSHAAVKHAPPLCQAGQPRAFELPQFSAPLAAAIDRALHRVLEATGRAAGRIVCDCPEMVSGRFRGIPVQHVHGWIGVTVQGTGVEVSERIV